MEKITWRDIVVMMKELCIDTIYTVHDKKVERLNYVLNELIIKYGNQKWSEYSTEELIKLECLHFNDDLILLSPLMLLLTAEGETLHCINGQTVKYERGTLDLDVRLGMTAYGVKVKKVGGR